MGIRSWVQRKLRAAGLWPKSETDELLQWLGVDPEKKKVLSEATYFACIKVLGESIGKLPLHLMRHVPGQGIVKAVEHPLYRVVNARPNSYMSAATCWTTIENNCNHNGNGFALIRGSGASTQLCPLPSQAVEVWVDDRGLWGAKNALWYIYNQPGGEKLRIPPDSMLHLRTSTTFDGITGASVREILQGTLEGSLSGQAMLERAYKSGFASKLALQYTGDPSPENERRYTAKMAEYVRSEDYQGVIPLMYGTTLTVLNTKLADNEFLGLKKYSALQIAAAFGVKPQQINDYEKSSYASAEAQQLAFYVDTLLYRIQQYEQELTAKLLTAQDIRDGYFFQFNVGVMLRADQKTQLEAMKAAVEGALYTPNEAREKLSMEAVDGGDRLLCNGNMLPVTMAGAAYGTGAGD